ncbi:MAG: DUF2283 domain-containing protein, partial [Dehalococcoidia bacterium]|nr:DUF2283 domain-containing protein [Dehalococcoidia bacterium]
MKVTYDPYADAVYIYLTTKKHELTTHVIEEEEIMVDIGENRVVVGIEILDASSRLNLEELKTLEFFEHGPPVSSEELRAELAAVREREAEYEA